METKRVFRYLERTSDKMLTYGRGQEKDLIGYVDSEFAGDHVDRMPTTGYVLKLADGALPYSSKKKTIVAFYTTETE